MERGKRNVSLMTLEVIAQGFITAQENLKPFYPEQIYLAIEECRQPANVEIVQLQTSGKEAFTMEWFDKGEKNANRFLVAYTTTANLVRQRISQLAITRGTA